MRGGTSKGLFFTERYPDHVMASAIGSPDSYKMQLNGLGAAISSTSKVAVVCPSNPNSKTDVDYLFGQVDIESGQIDWTGACGNLASAAAVFALQEGFVKQE